MLEKRVQDIYYTAMVTLQTNQCSHIKWGPHQEKAYDLSNSDQCQWWTVLSKRPTKHLHMHLQVFQQTSKCDILLQARPCCIVLSSAGAKKQKKIGFLSLFFNSQCAPQVLTPRSETRVLAFFLNKAKND